MSKHYGEDDYIACLAFAGTPPPIMSASEYLEKRVEYHDLVETFCINWFEGKPIDGQWAGFLSNYLSWLQRRETCSLSRSRPR